MKILEIVKGNTSKFSFYRNGMLYYDVIDDSGKHVCTFPVDITDTKDIGSATFSDTHKAITLMRYVRKAIEKETLEMVC